jgi:ABC-2 type transport system ATP-binding protein
MNTTPVIEAEGVVKHYDGVRALDGVSFTVGAGEVFALVGPNGAGKTTLLRLLTDILRPDAGELRLFGQARLRYVLGQVGYMPEERGLYRTLSPLETVAYFAQLKGMGAREAKRAAEEALEAVGMAGHARRKLEELSKGMSQRVQFAATLAHRPPLLLMDEPFSGLDPVSARDLQNLVLRLRAEGRTILLSTHNMEHAEKLCDRLLMLHRGRVHLYGSIEEIKARFTEDALLVECAGGLPSIPGARIEPLSQRRGDMGTQEGGEPGPIQNPLPPSSFLLHPSDGASHREILAALLAGGADIRRFEPVVPTLEDIFIRVVGAEGERALRETQEAHKI